jgi:hypothetical protein
MENFSLLLPTPIKTANILSSNVLDNEYQDWVAGSYNLGMRVHKHAGDLHYVFESTINNNTLEPDMTQELANNWARVGITNKFELFDPSISTQTVYPEYIQYTLQNIGRYNTLFLGNISAASVSVEQKDSFGTVIYAKTVNLIPNISAPTWFAYRYGSRARARELFLEGFSINANTTLKVTINNPGADVKIGILLLGVNKYFGNTQYGASFEIKDYSYVTIDKWGATKAIEAVYGRNASMDVHVDIGKETNFANILADYRAKFVLLRGAKDRAWLTSYGICKFKGIVTWSTVSIFNITIEGTP